MSRPRPVLRLLDTVRVPERPATKRGLLSALSSVLDLLGLVGPGVLYARPTVQDLVSRWRRLGGYTLTGSDNTIEQMATRARHSARRCA